MMKSIAFTSRNILKAGVAGLWRVGSDKFERRYAHKSNKCSMS